MRGGIRLREIISETWNSASFLFSSLGLATTVDITLIQGIREKVAVGTSEFSRRNSHPTSEAFMEVVIGVLLIVALLIWGFLNDKKKQDAMLQEVNTKYGTKFEKSDGFGSYPRIFFDPAARKILLIGSGAPRVEDFSFIRQ